MVDLLLVAAPENIFTYEVKNGKYELINVQGASGFPYDRRSPQKCISNYLSAIKNEFGYDNLATFNIKVTFPDDSVKHNFMCALTEKVKAVEVPMDAIATKIFDVLKNDKSLKIIDYGANIGLYCIRQDGSSIFKSPFSLLAYTVKFDEFGRYIG